METKNKIGDIIRDDELINDYEFEMRIYLTGLIEGIKEFSGKESLIFSGVY